jgi:ABC-type polysaccharide/polyol phosphate export permease
MNVRKELRDIETVAVMNLQWVRRLPLLFFGYALILPSVFAFMFIVISKGTNLNYVLLGTIIFSVVQPTFLGMAKNLMSDKFTGMLTYYKLLPISPLSLSLGVSLSSLAISAPALVLYTAFAIYVGAIGPVTVLGIIIVIVATVLTWIFFSGLGYLFAMSSSRVKQAQMSVDIIWAVLIFFSPAYYSTDVLPQGLRYVFYLNPVTYYSDLFRDCLTSSGSLLFILIDLAVIGALSVAMMLPMFRGWKWVDK